MTPLLLPVSVLKTILTGFNKIPWKQSKVAAMRHALVRRAQGAITLSVTDLDCHLTYTHRSEPEPITLLARKLAAMRNAGETCSFLVPIPGLIEAARSADHDSAVELAPDKIRFFVQESPIGGSFEAPRTKEFPDAPSITCIQQVMDARAQQAIANAFACASEDPTRLVLQGAFIGREPADDPAHTANHVIVGTNGRMLVRTNSMHFPALNHSFILPAIPLLRSRPLSVLPWNLGFQPGIEQKPGEPYQPKLHRPPLFLLTAGPWTLVGVAIAGNYPNYKQVIPLQHPLRVTLASGTEKSFADAIDRLPRVGHQPSVTLELAQGKELTVHSARNSVTAKGSRCSGGLRIAFDPDFIALALRMGFSELHLNDALDPAVFTAPGRQFVLMPMRSQTKPVEAKP